MNFMTMRRNYLWIYILAVPFIYTFLSFRVPPAMFSDSGFGFWTLKSMLAGAPFNYGVCPSVLDISKDSLSFNAWWSPGQYLIPAFFLLLKLNMGQALTAVTCLFSLSGVFGYFLLFKKLGFSQRTCLISSALIVSTRFFALPFGIYNGGEILLFGGLPWILIYSVTHSEIKYKNIPIYVFLFLLGCFLKLSFVICSISILLSLLLLKSFPSPPRKFTEVLPLAARAFLVFSFFYLILYLIFLSKGFSHPNAIKGFSLKISGIFYAFSGPLFSAFSVGDFLNRLLFFPGRPMLLSYEKVIPVLLIFGALSLCLLHHFKRHDFSLSYQAFSLGFWISHTVIFALFYCLGIALIGDDRYFRPAGVLLIPGVIEALQAKSTKSFLRIAGSVLILFFCLYGTVSFFVRYQANRLTNNIGRSGVTLPLLSRETLSWLHRLDDTLTEGNNIFYVTSPEIGLEIKKNRVLCQHADFIPLETLKEFRYQGRVDNIFIFLPKQFMTNGKAGAILDSFVDYADWKSLETDSHIIYYHTEKRSLPLLAV